MALPRMLKHRHLPRMEAATTGGRYANADYYQMLACSTVLDSTPAWLRYAGPGMPGSRELFATTTLITAYSIVLGREAGELLACFDALAESAKAMMKQADSRDG
ncbi:hypothetical protein CIK75_01960 [Glutamicibacter sp. BW78]|uniref:hypothetical protein n=1 Tax=Glutamicibacter sp. BW78 TaxID=2024403 RepID=UPI000BB73160|nr:hypothetical protein [Glutamicibacter sp. BW78]PCC26606.1 hypothetical protein CIK75_01960 [Glutamicibacter sp. BW78]